MLADGAGADHDGEAGQPGTLADDDVTSRVRYRNLAFGSEPGDVVGAGQDRDAVAEEGMPADRDVARGEVEERVVDNRRGMEVQTGRVTVDERPGQGVTDQRLDRAGT
jgi:hypothetical protein